MNIRCLSLLLLVGACDPYQPDASAWALRATTGPSPRNFSAMAFDPDRGRAVLFGGLDSNNTHLDDTWEWDGASWIRKGVSSGPAGRFAHSMAYDPVAHRVVLFGGAEQSDLWEWDGTAWSKRAPPDGPAGTGMMNYDSARGQLVVVTLDAENGNPQTFSWSVAGWERSDEGPPTNGAATAYDPSRWAMVVFGGRVGTTLSGATWERSAWWAQRATSGPAPRVSHAMTYDSVRHRTVLFGGTDGQTMRNDLWEWNGAGWLEVPSAGPPARGMHAMAFDSVRGKLIVFGGVDSDGKRLSDTWER